ncbi:hypothetical protein [Sporosarcina cascadiensis]|uniref:hypothetical protein n=1 Tax=Sporosarcina cascadiensis TaxID=2660747 RepID=UPI00129BAC20|nr:hypothetical protein [Sporosarcina cascadiensis]
MTKLPLYKVISVGNVQKFEDLLLKEAEQEKRVGKPGPWLKALTTYARQHEVISQEPHPDYTIPPGEQVFKIIEKNSGRSDLYRWGFQGGATGNHRIIYAIHNFSQVILLHYFNKDYNGAIKSADIVPAEKCYEEYCAIDPSLY